MIIFIDGYQNTGKTTLINNCKYKHGRFPFNQYLEKLSMNINDYQITKDLGICFTAQFVKDNVVLDRGPLSTVFYSLKENRYGTLTDEIMYNFLNCIKNHKGFEFVWVKKINNDNQIQREHNDGFDYLNDDNDENKEQTLKRMLNICDKLNIKVHIFEVDFSKKLKQNYHAFNNFLEELFNEHNRN